MLLVVVVKMVMVRLAVTACWMVEMVMMVGRCAGEDAAAERS